jgi:serine protease Do
MTTIRHHSRPISRAAPAAIALCAALGLDAVVANAQTTPTARVGSADAVVAQASELGRAFSDVAARVLPSVVSVHVESVVDAGEGMGFGGFFAPFPGEGRGEDSHTIRGSGSGVIIREDGVILTNYHVVERARRINVHLRDGRVLRGRVLGVDRATDLALVKVDSRSLPVARLGDSENARANPSG